jgi:DNA-binding winged helix-turn-helix (wHTH) protein
VEFSFGDHVLDLDRRELRRGGELVALEPQVCPTAMRSPVR